MSTLPDPIAQGLAAGWKVLDGALQADLTLSAEVVIIGSGAGGGMAAEQLTQAGLDVLVLEEGGLYSSQDFRLLESQAYPQLYQESANRQTQDKAITILQGRAVGGSTLVNWTSVFRTPDSTLQWWAQRYQLAGLSRAELQPWFEQAEARLGVADWQTAPNANNAVLARGCQALGWSYAGIRRNVRGCWNLGYCGMGCPTNAKQSMLVTTIAAALAQGARLIHRVRVERLLANAQNTAITQIEGVFLAADGVSQTGRRVRIQAGQVVLAAGAIGSPALLLRSQAPDAAGHTGQRTFLHPVALAAALMPEPVEAYNGAPQSIYSDHFMHTQALDGPLGYKLEVPPIHPVLAGVTFPGFGPTQPALLRRFPYLHAALALLRDGFHPDSQGGQVRLQADGSPLLDYPLNEVVWEGVRRAWLSMAELQFAAGAKQVLILHEQAKLTSRWAQAQQQIAQLPLQALQAKLVSAHVMGGLAMSAKPEEGVVDAWGQHWQWRNLTVVDGSVCPTSIGANPQLTIYALALRACGALLERLGAPRRAETRRVFRQPSQNRNTPRSINL